MIVILGFLGFGGFCVMRSQDALNDPAVLHERQAIGGSRDTQLYIGYISLGFGGVFAFVICCCCLKAINVSIAVVQEACNVLFDMPSLLVQPILELLIKGIATILLICGGLLLYSTAEVTSVNAKIGATAVVGVHREFVLTDEQKYMLGYWVFGTLWIQ